MSLSRRDFPQILQSVYDEATKALRVEGDITVSNPSVGPDGSPAPTDSNQVGGQDPNGNLQAVQLDANKNLKVLSVGGTLVPENYDNLVLTYVPSGNGAGQVQTVTYKLSTTTIATLTLSYDSGNNLTSVVRS